jgi:hypothetical protein
VLAELITASAAAPGEPRLAAMQAVVRRQAHHLRDREPVGDPGFVPRQLCLQATELGETLLAADCRARQLASDDPGPVLQWTTRRASPALILELGRHDGAVTAVAVLPDGRVISAGDDDRVRLWMCKAAHPAVCSHARRTRSLPPSPHLELAFSSVTHGAGFHAGRYEQRHGTLLESGNMPGNAMQQQGLGVPTVPG